MKITPNKGFYQQYLEAKEKGEIKEFPNKISLDTLIEIALEAAISKITEQPNRKLIATIGKYGAIMFFTKFGYEEEELKEILPDDFIMTLKGVSIHTPFKKYLFPEDCINDYRRLHKIQLNGHNGTL